MESVQEEAAEEEENSSANILIVGLDSNGQIIFVNEECEETTGYDDEELLGRSFWELSPSEEGEEIEKFFSNSHGMNLPSSYKMPWIGRDGTKHDIVWELIQFKRSEKDIGIIMGAGVDTTSWKNERRGMETKLEELRHIYHELADESLNGVYIIEPTPEGLAIRFANSQLRNMFGYEEGELMGKNFGNLIHSDYIPEIEEIIQEIRESNGGKSFNIKGKKKDGENFWLKNRLSLVSFKGEPALLGMAKEIKMQEKTREEEEKNSEKYKAIADFAKVGLGIIQDGKIVYLNDQMVKNFECSKEELREFGFSHFVHPEDKEELDITFRDKIPEEELPYDSSYRAITKEGKVKYLSLHATRVEYEGKPATQLVIRDVTEQKETEKRLRDQRKELRQAYKHLRETESKLTKKTEELRQANEMRAKFMDVLAHELRSYLTPVGAYIGTIKLGELGDITSEQKEKLEEASKKLDKIDQLVEDTLDLSRMEADRVRLSKESIFLPDMIEEIIGDFEPEIKEKNHELLTNLSEDVPIVAGDPNLLEKVFRNLISNAIQYTPKGGKISVEVSQAEENGVHFKVSDTGIGIPEEHQDRIFQKFYRVEENSNDEPRGLGMGLAIAKHFVELHGGEIWVESEVGEGSTFHVKLPKKR